MTSMSKEPIIGLFYCIHRALLPHSQGSFAAYLGLFCHIFRALLPHTYIMRVPTTKNIGFVCAQIVCIRMKESGVVYKNMCHVGWLRDQQAPENQRALLQNSVSFIGLFCKRDLWNVCIRMKESGVVYNVYAKRAPLQGSFAEYLLFYRALLRKRPIDCLNQSEGKWSRI